jgi:WD repeat-containing protein 81
MKFQSVLASQQQQQLSSHNSIDGGVEETDSHLTGQWSDLWESRLHQSPHHLENYTHFMGKKLQIYTGHKGAVRSLAVSDSEHFFLSASKDRTVKLWLLRNQGGGSTPQISAHLTYSQHQKPVSQVELVPTTGDILSCDGAVHLWDPEFGHTIHQYSSPRGREFVAMTTFLPPQQVAIVATNDPAIRFIDFRTDTIQHMWKIHPSFGSLVKCLCCGDNWVAVGSTGGTVSTLDLRMGALLHQWRPSEFNLVPTTTWNENLFQLLSTRHGNLVTSVGAGTMHLWRPSTGKLLSHIRGQSSTTPCLDYMGQQLISASSNGQVVVHNSFERTKDPSSTLFWVTKVRSRELKGGVVSIATLQEKRLLLLGSENGQVVLMS